VRAPGEQYDGLGPAHFQKGGLGTMAGTSCKGTLAEIVKHKYNGLVVEDYSKNPKAFAKAIDSLSVVQTDHVGRRQTNKKNSVPLSRCRSNTIEKAG
jgi:hypothetical protein